MGENDAAGLELKCQLTPWVEQSLCIHLSLENSYQIKWLQIPIGKGRRVISMHTGHVVASVFPPWDQSPIQSMNYRSKNWFRSGTGQAIRLFLKTTVLSLQIIPPWFPPNAQAAHLFCQGCCTLLTSSAGQAPWLTNPAVHYDNCIHMASGDYMPPPGLYFGVLSPPLLSMSLALTIPPNYQFWLMEECHLSLNF